MSLTQRGWRARWAQGDATALARHLLARAAHGRTIRGRVLAGGRTWVLVLLQERQP